MRKKRKVDEVTIYTPFYNEVDFGDLGDISTMAKAGKDDALAGRPSSDSSSLPHIYTKAQDKARRHYDRAIHVCQSELNALEIESNNLADRVKSANLDAQVDGICSTFVNNTEHSVLKSAVQQCKKKFDGAKENLQRFKLEHRISYDPIRATSMLTWLILAVLYISESVINGFMFIETSGFLPGLIISLSASAVNVFLGFWVGRYVLTAMVYHHKKTFRVINGGIFLIFVFVITWLNLMLAVYRSIQETGIREFDFARNTVASVVPIANLDKLEFIGVLLIGVGAVFAISAVMDGWFSDDPFPRYGTKYRECLKQKEATEKHLAQYQALFIENEVVARQKLDALYITASKSIEGWSKNINLIQRRFVDYEEWANGLNELLERYWMAYLSEHEDHRTDNYRAPPIMDNDPLPFLSEGQIDPREVFGAVAQVYMDDKTRLQRVEKMRSEFDENYVRYREQLNNTASNLKANLKKLEKEAECHI